MGNLLVLSIDREAANIDKLCRLALELVHVRKLSFDAITVVGKGAAHDADLDGDPSDRGYQQRKGRSMTELYALRTGLGTADASGVVCVASPIVGLVALCQTLAEHNNKVPGKSAGGLYKRGMVSLYAKELATIPQHASEIVSRLVKIVAAALLTERPVDAFRAPLDKGWDAIDAALSAAGRADYEKARDMVRDLETGRSPNGRTFPIAKATGQYVPQGIAIETRNPNLMKHMWAALKERGTSFMVATAIVSHPDTKRIAVLCSTQYPVDIRPVAKALRKRFPGAEIDVNVERGSIVWDPRSNAPGPTLVDMLDIVSTHLAFKTDERVARSTGLGATIGDAFRQQMRKRR